MTNISSRFQSITDHISDLHQQSSNLRAALARAGATPPQEFLDNLDTFDRSLRRLERRANEQDQELRQLHALAKVGQIINSSLNLTTVLNEVMDTIITLTGAERGFMMLIDRQGRLGFRIARNVAQENLEEDEFEISRTIVEQVVASGETILTTNAQEDPRFGEQKSVTTYNLRSILCVPLKVKGRLTGVIYADNRVRTGLFKRRDRDILMVFADQAAVAIENARLFKDLNASKHEIEEAYDATLEGWVHALDLRDRETEGHTKRVTELTMRLARTVGIEGDSLIHVRRGALLHDIGKIGIPDHILTKPGPLSPDEEAIMRRHPVYAYEMLSPIAYLRPALEIPYCHHEKWNGSGYPRGLHSEEIPKSARIFALADVWDALRYERPYRHAWPEEKIRAHILELAGVHFDPAMVEVFLNMNLVI